LTRVVSIRGNVYSMDMANCLLSVRKEARALSGIALHRGHCRLAV